MLKKRTIQPDIWRDEDFGKLSDFAQLVYFGLITQSDDEGRQIGHPSVICSVLFPYKGVLLLERTVNALHEISKKMRNIIFYEHDEQFYIQFKNWHKHQYIRDDRAQKSLFPAPINKQNTKDNSNVVEKVRIELEEKGILLKTK